MLTEKEVAKHLNGPETVIRGIESLIGKEGTLEIIHNVV